MLARNSPSLARRRPRVISVRPAGILPPIQAVRPSVGECSQTGFCEFIKPDFGQENAIVHFFVNSQKVISIL